MTLNDLYAQLMPPTRGKNSEANSKYNINHQHLVKPIICLRNLVHPFDDVEFPR